MANRDWLKSSDASLDEEERELMDAETWDWASDPVAVGRVRTLYELSVVLPKEAYRPLKALAAQQGLTQVQLAQRYLTDRIEAEQAAGTIGRGFTESA